MTLGVIDEMRSKGLANQLLKEVLLYASNRPTIGLVHLDVVAYNKRAINFYRKSNF